VSEFLNFNFSRTWDHGKVPYYFDDPDDIDQSQARYYKLRRLLVERVTKDLMRVSNCLYFREITDTSSTRNYINFTTRGDERNTKDGCWSYIGMQGGGQVINLDPKSDCLTPETVAHEILHALGIYHEHNRFDRDEYVTINWDNIKEDRENLKNFEKIKSEDPVLGSKQKPYDFTSIMHYSAYSRSKNGQKTIEIKNCHSLCGDDLKDVGPRNGKMSFGDMWALNKLYICPDVGESWKLFLNEFY